MDTADVVAIVISLFALAGTGLGLWFTKDANRISKESKELSKEANDIARRAFESETVRDIKIVLGLSQDVITSPPTDLFEIQAGNHGRLPVVIQHVGVFIVGSVITIPLVHSVVDKQDLSSKLPDLLPFEVLPGRVLDIPVPMEHLRKSLALNAKSPEDQFTVRLYQPTGQFFESASQPVASYLGEELPYRVRFPEGPPPPKNRAGVNGGALSDMIDQAWLFLLRVTDHLIGRRILYCLGLSVIRSDVNRNVLRVTKFAVNVALFAFIRIGRIVPACLLLDVAVIYPFDGIAEGLHRLKREVDDLVPRVANAGANGWDPDLVWVFENATALPAKVVQRLRRSPSRR